MTVDTSICMRPAVDLAGMIRTRAISSRELLELHLERIRRINPSINAVVTLDIDTATAAAREADRLTAGGAPLGPLHGLPVTIKDAIEVAGMRSTGGSAQLSGHVPAQDPPVVSRLRRAGAVIMGKTNVPEWSADIQTFNHTFGTTSNPWDTSRTPGGSSGGPAAAVATGMAAFDIGTDIGGSVRIPSSFCGTFAHKPTFGVVPQTGYLDHPAGGVIPADINVFGPIARSVADLARTLDVIAGPAGEEARGWRLELPPPRHDSITGYRVGVWLDDPHCAVEGEAVSLTTAAAARLADAGAAVSEARPPLDLGLVERLYTSLVLPAVSVSLPGEQGRAVAGNHRDWLDLTRERESVRRTWAEWFGRFDVLLCPVVPMLPFPHDQEGSFAERHVIINGRARSQAGTLAWTGLVGVAYLPSTVVPVGITAGGLPVGIQVVGPYLEDRTTLFVAGVLSDLCGGFRPPPLAAEPPGAT